MLQQTRVATVIPYYRRFLRAFPTVRHLARARLERVLEAWSGLGYYRRARNLHRAAKIVARKFGGRFPHDYEQARSLPGVRDYTARAVLSIAYNQPYAVMDGNVTRVVSRLRAFRGNFNQPSFRHQVGRELDRLLSRPRPASFNQALMELGQTVCLPRAPHCPACPLRARCRACGQGTPESFPSRRPRRASEHRYLAAGIIRRGNSLALVRGLDEGLLEDLWNFPAAFAPSRRKAVRRLEEKLAALASGWARIGARLGELRHGITYRSISVDFYPVEITGTFRARSVHWVPLARLPRSAVSQLARKIAAQL